MRRREKASLDGVRDKINRAKFHRDELQSIIGPISYLRPHPFTGEIRKGGRDHLYRWNNPPVLDSNAELILGDCIHNLRSALDHLAYQLIVLNKKTPNNRSSFPIRRHPPRKRWKWWGKTPFLLANAGTSTNQIIESIQPYKGTDIGRRLAELRDLDNIDKHRHVLLTFQAVDAASTAWFGDAPEYGTPHTVFLTNPPVHGQMAVRVTWPIPRPNLDPFLHFTVGVRFDKRLGKQFGRRPVSGLTSTLVSTVEHDVVDELFAPLFP